MVRPFVISGALRLVPMDRSIDSVGIVAYSSAKDRGNIIFTARENKAKRIRSFQPINDSEPYDLIASEVSHEFHFLLDERGASIGDKMVLCYFHGPDAYYFDSTVLMRGDAKRFEDALMSSTSYSAYSIRSYLIPAYSQKVNDLLRFSGGLKSAWAQTEMGFFQRSEKYWGIVERREVDKNKEVIAVLGGRTDPDALLAWLKQFPLGYLNDVETWIHIWTKASDFGRQSAVLAEMGKDFLVDVGLLSKESFGVVARLRGILSQSGWQEIYESAVKSLGDAREALVDMSYLEVEAAVRLQQFLTFELFSARGRSRFSAEPADMVLRSWKRAYHSSAGRTRNPFLQEWVSAQIKFFLDVESTWPSRSSHILASLNFAVTTSIDLSVEEQTDLLAFGYAELLPILLERKAAKQRSGK